MAGAGRLIPWVAICKGCRFHPAVALFLYFEWWIFNSHTSPRVRQPLTFTTVFCQIKSDTCPSFVIQQFTSNVLWLYISVCLSVSLCVHVCGVSPGWPKLLWFVTESKHLSKTPRDWFPHIKDANNDTAYIEVTVLQLHLLWLTPFACCTHKHWGYSSNSGLSITNEMNLINFMSGK